MTVFAVDVSNHDYDRGALNWQSVRGAGIEVAIAKATEGDPTGYHYTDPYFVKSVTDGRAAGMKLMGGYHCLSHGGSGSIESQVNFFIERLNQVGGPSKCWAMLDVEPFSELKSRGMAPQLSDVIAFERLWHIKTGRVIAHYIPNWYWHDLRSPSLSGISGPLISSNYPISARQAFVTLYGHAGGDSGPGWTGYGGKTPTLWQFGSSAAVPGISGSADCNAYRGTYEQLITTLTGVHPAPSHPAWPGVVLHVTSPMMHSTAISTWQKQMAHRGWKLGVDGYFGPESSSTAAQFQSEKHVTADKSGTVGKATWDASWTAPIT